jgi:hypothetical protein
LGASRSRLHSG